MIVQAVKPGPRGFSLLEVVIGMFIFAVGMLALASLQGQLTRSQADAALRSVATNIAQEAIEDLRAFGRLDADPAGQIPAYADITSGVSTINRGGLSFEMVTEVTDYYYDPATDSFGTGNPQELVISDFKEVSVAVSWAAAPGFRIAEGVELQAEDLGTGSISLTETISSVTTQGAGRSSTQNPPEDITPDVTYTPGQNPEVVSLSIGENRFKESTTPKPRVYRTDELVETRFDVITYSQSQSGALFLRREEFISVSCDCELAEMPASPEGGGRRPTTWAGDEYALGEYVVKPVGIAVGPQQSQFCDECCRDHHDGGSVAGDSATALYDPFRAAADYWDSGSFTGDHKHYSRNNQGNLVLATATGDPYVEACRMVRVDGFMRIAQDIRQEGKNAFPENFLDEDAELEDYSDWVTGSVDAFENVLAGNYETSPPSLASPPQAPDAGGFPVSTTLPTLLGQESQQLRSRGVYVDYLSDDLRTVLDCVRALPAGDPVTACSAGAVVFDRAIPGGVLEIIPFFDVQLTWLDRWSETPANDPVDTSNEPVQTENAHSRGVATLSGSSGTSVVAASGHRGNPGLTDTDPVAPGFDAGVRTATLEVAALTAAPPPPAGTIVISGTISSGVPGLRATDIEVAGSNANCNRLPDGYACEFSNAVSPVTITISGYKKQGQVLAACSLTLSAVSNGVDANGRGFAVFDLVPVPALDPALSHDIWVQADGCL